MIDTFRYTQDISDDLDLLSIHLKSFKSGLELLLLLLQEGRNESDSENTSKVDDAVVKVEDDATKLRVWIHRLSDSSKSLLMDMHSGRDLKRSKHICLRLTRLAHCLELTLNSVFVGPTRMTLRHIRQAEQQITTIYDIIQSPLGLSEMASSTPVLRPVESTSENLEVPMFQTLATKVLELLHIPTFPLLPRRILIIGSQGSGKSYLCRSIEQHLTGIAVILRPQIPRDLLGSTVGEMEDTLYGIFAPSDTLPTCILLDNVDDVVVDDGNGEKDHRIQQCRSILLTLLDESQSFIICTASSDSVTKLRRFDYVHHILEPDDGERLRFLEGHAATLQHKHQHKQEILQAIVDCSGGKSYGELELLWQHAIAFCDDRRGIDGHDGCVLSCLKAILSSSNLSASANTAELDSTIDYRLLTSRQLLSISEENDNHPLQGKSAHRAYDLLHATIVTPLSHARQLGALLGRSESYFNTKTIGALLVGESGTGKTHLVHQIFRMVCANLQQTKLLEVNCASLVHKELGESERGIKRLFTWARKHGPCILVLDGIEDIAAVRGNDNTTEGTMDRVLSTLLIEMDGVQSSKKGYSSCPLAVIGVTLHEKVVDPALLRPGRLERVIRLDLPDFETRMSIIKMCLANTATFEVPDHVAFINELATKTEGLSGASVLSICNSLVINQQ